MGNPFCACHGCGLFQHLIDLFQGKALGFRDDEVSEEVAERERASPDEEHFHAEIPLVLVYHVWGDDGNHAVPEPVRRG